MAPELARGEGSHLGLGPLRARRARLRAPVRAAAVRRRQRARAAPPAPHDAGAGGDRGAARICPTISIPRSLASSPRIRRRGRRPAPRSPTTSRERSARAASRRHRSPSGIAPSAAIGPDDATLAAPVSHGAPTPATHAMSHPAPTISSAATGHQLPASPTKRRSGRHRRRRSRRSGRHRSRVAVVPESTTTERTPSRLADVAANEAPAAADRAKSRPSRRAPNRTVLRELATDSTNVAASNVQLGCRRPPRVTAPNMPAPPLAAHGLAADAPAASDRQRPSGRGRRKTIKRRRRWAMPPAEAFAIFGLVADAWRQRTLRLRALHPGGATFGVDAIDHLDVPASSSSGSGLRAVRR